MAVEGAQQAVHRGLDQVHAVHARAVEVVLLDHLDQLLEALQVRVHCAARDQVLGVLSCAPQLGVLVAADLLLLEVGLGQAALLAGQPGQALQLGLDRGHALDDAQAGHAESAAGAQRCVAGVQELVQNLACAGDLGAVPDLVRGDRGVSAQGRGAPLGVRHVEQGLADAGAQVRILAAELRRGDQVGRPGDQDLVLGLEQGRQGVREDLPVHVLAQEACSPEEQDRLAVLPLSPEGPVEGRIEGRADLVAEDEGHVLGQGPHLLEGEL